VPVDPTAPALRGAGIFADAGVKAVVVAAGLAADLRRPLAGPGPTPRLIVVGARPRPLPGRRRLARRAGRRRAVPLPRPLARRPRYVLYTSGSTGRPGG